MSPTSGSESLSNGGIIIETSSKVADESPSATGGALGFESPKKLVRREMKPSELSITVSNASRVVG